MANEINDSFTSSKTYENVIAAIAGNCAAHIDGIASVNYEAGLNSSIIGQTKKNNAIEIKIVKEFVTVTISVNVYYGENIPKTICALQEKIKDEVEKSTFYKIKAINVNVVGVISHNC